MRKIWLFVLVLLPVLGFSQAWTENLPDKDRGSYTLNDYQDAFYKYVKEHKVKYGYETVDGEKVKMSGYKQFKRWEWYWETQVDREGNFPKQTAAQAIRDYEKHLPLKRMQVDEGNWVNLGTSSSEGGYHGIGRLNCISFHPTDINTYWVGAPVGGVWVTRDNGTTWEVLTDNNAVLGVNDIVIPSDYETSKTIYIATGDKNANNSYSIGVLKSTDDGKTWKETGLTFDISSGRQVTRLLIDPDNNNVLIAATNSGVFKTTDGGLNWGTKLSSNYFVDMEYKPGDFSTLYGSTKSGQIYSSTDDGTSWELAGNAGRRTELAVTPANPELVYAIRTASNNALEGIYKSINSGESFTKVFSGEVSGNNLLGWYASNDYSDRGQGFYDLCIAASPTDENLLLIGGINTWRSKDGGETWKLVNAWHGGVADGVQEVHADKHMLKFRSNGDLFECNDGGVYFSKKSGDSYSWEDKTNGIINSQIYKLSVAKQKEDEVLTGLQDNGSKLRIGDQWRDVKGGDGMECLIDYSDINIQYATYVNGQIDRTTNHWNSRRAIQPNDAGEGAWVTPYIIDPENPAVLYAGYKDVWKTTNRGNDWVKLGSVNSYNFIREMAICQSDNRVIWLSDHNYLYKTTNGGENWEKISPSFATGALTYIAIKNSDPNVVWVTVGGYAENKVFVTRDGGSSWENISAGIPPVPANTIVYDASVDNLEILYVGTEFGVYQKAGNEDFIKFSSGLPNVKIAELEIYYDEDPMKNKLRAATYGRGLWESSITGVFTPPVAEVKVSSNSVLEGSTLQFTDASSFYPNSRKWYFEGGIPATSTEKNPSVKYNKEGIYSVALVSTNDLGSDSVYMENFISVYTTENTPPLNLMAEVVENNVALSWTSPEGEDIVVDEDFESTWPPLGWSVKYSQTIDGAMTDPTDPAKAWFHCDESSFGTSGSPQFIHSGSYSAAISFSAKDFNWLITDEVMVKDNFELRFWLYYQNNDDNKWYTNFDVLVQNNGTWDTLAIYNADSASNLYEREQVFSLSKYSGKIVQLAFVYDYNDGYEVAIDDVYIGISKGTAKVNRFATTTPSSRMEGTPSATFVNSQDRAINQYKVFRDSALIATIDGFENTSYIDEGLESGSYRYFVTAFYGETGEESSGSNQVSSTIYDIPKSDFIADITEGQGPLTVTFTNKSVNAKKYLWEFGDGETSEEENPTHLFDKKGSYTVTLYSYSDHFVDTLVKTDYITVTYPEVIADFEATPVSGTKPLEVMFVNKSTGATNYLWDFGNGAQDRKANPTYIFTSPNSYTITLIAYNTGNSDTLIRKDYIDVLVSVEDENGLSSVAIYPNPAKNVLHIEFNEFDSNNSVVEVIDISGKVVMNQKLGFEAEQNMQLNISTLETGAYFVRISSPDGAKVFKFHKK